MHYTKKFSPSAGIAIGPILFVLAMLAVLASVMASGGSDFQTASGADRITADITAQANLIRNVINECHMQTVMSVSMLPEGVDPPSDTYPSTPAGNLVADVKCDPLNESNPASLWGAVLLPQPTKGFNPWRYVNAGLDGGRCIWTSPLSANASGNAQITSGLSRAASRFNTANVWDATAIKAEAMYLPSGNSQKFVLWITPPSAFGSASNSCAP